MRLLDLFERGRPELSLAEFVRRSGYSKSTTYRLLVTLVEAGWLERSPAGAFRLTIKAFQVGSVLVDSLELRREAGPIMARIAAELDEAVYLVVAAGTRAVCLERIDSEQGVRLRPVPPQSGHSCETLKRPPARCTCPVPLQV